MKWCAVTGARQFQQPNYGKAIENMSAQNTIVVMCPAVIDFCAVHGYKCVFQPNQPQRGDCWTGHASTMCSASGTCIVDNGIHTTNQNNNKNNNNNHNNNKNYNNNSNNDNNGSHNHDNDNNNNNDKKW